MTTHELLRQCTGKDIGLRRDRYGYHVAEQYFRRVTTLLDGVPKPALTGWAAKKVAEYAIEHHDSWIALPPRDAVKLLKGAPWSTRDDAADRGSAIHHAIEAHLEDKPVPGDLTEDQASCVAAVQTFLREFVAEVLAVEMTVVSATHGYAGTLDLWCRDRDGAVWILDWKSSKNVYETHAIQQAAYRHAEFAIIDAKQIGAAESWVGRLLEWGPHRADRMGIVHVQPGEATLYPIDPDDKRLWTVFQAAAHTKLFLLDTDSFAGRVPRYRVYGEPVRVLATAADNAAVDTPTSSGDDEMIVRDTGANFTPAPAGAHAAVCIDVIDRGMMEFEFGGEKKQARKLVLRWALAGKDENGRQFTVQNMYTASLNERATLRKHLDSWRRKAFTADELKGFDLDTVIGVGCQLVVVHKERNGRTYANVEAVLPPEQGAPPVPVPPDYILARDRTEQGNGAASAAAAPAATAEPEPEPLFG